MKIKDQLQREINLETIPQRIISLVPSQTELLYDLGLKDQMIGQTIFCIHPKHYFKKVIKIGGTKKLNIQKIKELKPDLIIANKEENEREQIEELAKDFPVWISDVNSVNDALAMIKSIGKLTGKERESVNLLDKISTVRKAFNVNNFEKKSVLYLIWNDPYMAVGKNTFIDAMIEEAGFENKIEALRYPILDLEEIAQINPDYIFLSSEPFPFKKEHAEKIDAALNKKVCIFVDGEMFSWYGSRLSLAYRYFIELRNRVYNLKYL